MSTIHLVSPGASSTRYTHDPVIAYLDDLEATYSDLKAIDIVWSGNLLEANVGSLESMTFTDYRGGRYPTWDAWRGFTPGTDSSRRIQGQVGWCGAWYYSVPGTYRIEARIYEGSDTGAYSLEVLTIDVVISARPGNEVYWSPTGSDANSGASSGAAVLTLDRALQLANVNGSEILLERGSTYDESHSGAAQWQLTSSVQGLRYGAYGSGAVPELLAGVSGATPDFVNFGSGAESSSLYDLRIRPNTTYVDHGDAFVQGSGGGNNGMVRVDLGSAVAPAAGSGDFLFSNMVVPGGSGFAMIDGELRYCDDYMLRTGGSEIVSVGTNWSGGSRLEHAMRHLGGATRISHHRPRVDWRWHFESGGSSGSGGGKSGGRWGNSQYGSVSFGYYLSAETGTGFDSSGTFDIHWIGCLFRGSPKLSRACHADACTSRRVAFKNMVYDLTDEISISISRSVQKFVDSEYKEQAEPDIEVRDRVRAFDRVIARDGEFSREPIDWSAADLQDRDPYVSGSGHRHGKFRIADCEQIGSAFYEQQASDSWIASDKQFTSSQSSAGVSYQGSEPNVTFRDLTLPDPSPDRVCNHDNGTIQTKAQFQARSDTSGIQFASLTPPTHGLDDGDVSLAAVMAPTRYAVFDANGHYRPWDGSNVTKDAVELNPVGPNLAVETDLGGSPPPPQPARRPILVMR